MATKTRSRARKPATAPKRRRTRTAMSTAPRRRRSSSRKASTKFDLVNIIAKPALGFAIGSIAANFIGNMTGIPTFVKPIIPFAGAFATVSFLKEPMIAAGMAAAGMAAAAKTFNIPLLSDPSDSDFPLLADYNLPILAEGTVLADDMGNFMTLADGGMYSSNNASVGGYYGGMTI